MPTGHDAARLHPAASDVRTRCSGHARRVQPRCRPDRKWSPCDVKRALPETDIVPCAELVTGLDQPADTDEPMPLVQPDARLVGQGNHPNGAVEALAAQAGPKLGVQGVAPPTTLPRGIDVDRGLCGPLVGGPIVPWRRVCHADNAVIGGYQPGELRVQSSPDVAPFIDGLWFGPEVDERVFDVVVDDLADLGQVILGGGPDPQPRSLAHETSRRSTAIPLDVFLFDGSCEEFTLSGERQPRREHPPLGIVVVLDVRVRDLVDRMVQRSFPGDESCIAL